MIHFQKLCFDISLSDLRDCGKPDTFADIRVITQTGIFVGFGVPFQ